MSITNSLQLMQYCDSAGFEQEVSARFKADQVERIMAAYKTAKWAHRHQVRDCGGRYFEHVKTVALLLVRSGVTDADVICAALLHDVVEDCETISAADIERYFDLVKTASRESDRIVSNLMLHVKNNNFVLSLETIKLFFGNQVGHLVNAVTKKKGLSLVEYFVGISTDVRSILIKLADRLHNLSTLPDSKSERGHLFCCKRKLRQVKQTRELVLALAVALSQTSGYEELGQWFFTTLTEWCNQRELEAGVA
jgi:guanosine-3',5'-bis(diphosphate) 3'-pyrophosphohydrolase